MTPKLTPATDNPTASVSPALEPTKALMSLPPIVSISTEIGVLLPETTRSCVDFSIATFPEIVKKSCTVNAAVADTLCCSAAICGITTVIPSTDTVRSSTAEVEVFCATEAVPLTAPRLPPEMMN